MGKLNYTNRKISGEKLGSAVKRDVLKFITQAAKTTRFPKDPHIELNLQGKFLCDEGLKLACEGLTKALGSGSAKLDELNLSENKLTIAGLSYLTEVITLSSRDLKDLDLRHNDIRICTEEEAEIWERFLTGFREVCSLRRFDISENPLGDRGIEILLNVYARESPVILPRVARSTVAESEDEDEDYNTGFEEGDSDETDAVLSSQLQPMGFSAHRELLGSPPNLHSTPARSAKSCSDDYLSSTLSPSTSLASGIIDIHGLRSIPYLILSKTELSDKAALFLSYILPVHPSPDSLLRYLPQTRPGFQAEILDRYDRLSGCFGIVYQKNEQFTSMGYRVLELAENIRNVASPPAVTPIFARNRHVSDASNTPSTPIRFRRESMSSSHSMYSPYVHGGGGAVGELERARSKIQGNLLKESGIGSVELWRTALQMLAISRTILFDKDNIGSEYFSFSGRNSHFSSPLRSGFCPLNPLPPGFHGGSLNYQQGANLQQRHPHIFGASTATDRLSFTQTGDSPPRREMPSPPSPTQNAFPPSKTANTELRQKKPRSLPGNLPEDIWVHIIMLAADPKHILSAKQRRNVVVWARTGDTLDLERELAGKLKSLQIWRLLDGLECLSCEV